MPKLLINLCLPLLGASSVFAFAPFDYWPLIFITLGSLALSLYHATPRQALWRGWLFGLGYFLAGIHWTYVSIHVFGNAPISMAVILTVLLSATMALYPALASWLACKITEHNKHLLLLALPATWALSEWLRGTLFTGFPWLASGYSQLASPLAGFAPVLGVYGVGALCMLVASALALLKFASLRQAVIAISLVLAIGLSGLALKQVQWSQPNGEAFSVALVQGNISQDNKWQLAWRKPTLDRYQQLTRAHWDAVDVVIWPEVAIPGPYDFFSDFFTNMTQGAEKTNTQILTGVMRNNPSGNYSNAIVQLGQPPTFYRKQHLVPFGEYFPVPNFVRDWLKAMQLPYSDIQAGTPNQPLLQINGVPIGASICYEDVFGEEIMQALPAAQVLVNVTNDAWFGDSLAPHQHLQIARMRALEASRYLLRANNTGHSAIIGPKGELKHSLPAFKTQVLRGTAQPHTGLTPYARWTNWPIILLALSLIIILLFNQKSHA